MDLYRFRNIDSLLDKHQELERQEIFFAAPSLLNDPMEGFQDIFWSGDYIVWKNLFRHYLYCLERICSIVNIARETFQVTEAHIPVFQAVNDFPTPEYKELFGCISNNFLNHPHVANFIESINSRQTPIRRDEIFFYLTIIHKYALDAIFDEYEKRKLIDPTSNSLRPKHQPLEELLKNDFMGLINQTAELTSDKFGATELFSYFSSIVEQMNLLSFHSGSIKRDSNNINLVSFEFPTVYLSRIEKLIFPDWYTACFMQECKNSSVWGHYGDNHKGVCLIFNTELDEGKPSIKLKRTKATEEHAYQYESLNCQFHAVTYIDGYTQIDFFRSLGLLSITALNSTWYSDGESLSECGFHLNESDKWKDEYWKQFYKVITSKSNDWAYEKEYRLIFNNMLLEIQSAHGEAFKYDFSSLKGIIFGIKTSTDDKLKIIKIIEAKCTATGRDDFKFYQAVYSHKEKCIIHKELTLFEFSKDD